MGERIDLVSLPANPPPNTHVGTNLDALATAVQQALREQFATALDGQLGPVGEPLDEAQEAIIEQALWPGRAAGPVAVPAGVASLDPVESGGLGTVGQLALGGLLVVAAGAGLAGYRRPGR